MAPARTPDELSEFARFLDAVKRLGGYKVNAQWSRDAGVHATNLSDALNGKATVDGFNLYRLIRAAAERAEVTPDLAALAAASDLEARFGEAADLLLQRLDEVAQIVRSPDRSRSRADGGDG